MFNRKHFSLAASALESLALSAQHRRRAGRRDRHHGDAFAAGSSSDTAGRVLAVGLSEALGQQVVIENVGGGGGMTGTARVAKGAARWISACVRERRLHGEFRPCTNDRSTTA